MKAAKGKRPYRLKATKLCCRVQPDDAMHYSKMSEYLYLNNIMSLKSSIKKGQQLLPQKR